MICRIVSWSAPAEEQGLAGADPVLAPGASGAPDVSLRQENTSDQWLEHESAST